MARSQKVYKVKGGVHSKRDTILGNQYNFTDLSQVETYLQAILELLRDMQSKVRVIHLERDRKIIRIEHPEQVVDLPVEFTSRLGDLQRQVDPHKREEIYLARFIFDSMYARWERMYLPLEGILYMEPVLRLKDTTDQAISPSGTRLNDLRQALKEYDKTRLVILGEPGAGKTTTLERLALDLARERLVDPLMGKIPIRIDLYKYTDLRNPSDFLTTEWGITGLAETYGEAILRGQVCFLLDGINQMPRLDRAQRIDKWAHWATSHNELPEGNWAIFTCRTADYTPNLRLPEVHVQTLDREHMQHYFELRFGPEQAARHWVDFDRQLSSGNQRFEHLARNPFMLSLLADNVSEGQGLTDNRARLMSRLAHRLLEHELQEGRQPTALTDDIKDTMNCTLQALSRIAFQMQRNRGEGTSISDKEINKIKLFERSSAQLELKDLLGFVVNALVLERTTILRGQVQEPGYVFYHHLLQEYFAARRLVELFREKKSLWKYVRVSWRNLQLLPRKLKFGEKLPAIPTTGWEETAIMAASLAGKDAPGLISMIARYNLPLAGRGLASAGIERPEFQEQVKALRQALLQRQRNPRARMNARIDAGLALGELGHPELLPKPFEFEGHTVYAIQPPMQPIPEGEFLFGSDPHDPQAFKDEYTAQRQVRTESFSAGRYLVTNAEFRYFILAAGYKEDRWWSKGGNTWRQGGPDAHQGVIDNWLNFRKFLQSQDLDQIARQFGWLPWNLAYWKRMVKLTDEEALLQAQKQFERPFDRPAFWDDPELSSRACPVVGVNWYEAEAYCNWLSSVTGQTYRLPSEVEWEKSARGTDGRTYAWGNQFDASLCNSLESHIYTTSPVGMYPRGTSPFGLMDACGNVGEWTASWYQAYPGGDPEASKGFGERFRVVRGGAWSNDRRFVRCACRGWFVPDFFDIVVGFRLVSPGIFLDSEC